MTGTVQPRLSSTTRRHDGRRRIANTLLVLALVLLAVEVTLRIFVAIELGPRAFLYGTSLFRQQISVAREKHIEWNAPKGPELTDPAQSPSHHGDIRDGYSKYFPYETKVDVDDAGAQFSYRLNARGLRGPDLQKQDDARAQ